MLSMHGILSTRGKTQPPLNSLFKIQADSGQQALIQEGVEDEVCLAKTEIELVVTRNRNEDF